MHRVDMTTRSGVILFFAVSIHLILAFRIGYFQVFKHNDCNEKLIEESKAIVSIKTKRGLIYDRNFRVLAATIDLKREYPRGSLAGNLIGFVSTDCKGLEGIEYKFNEELSGTAGLSVYGKTARGNIYPYPGYERRTPIPSKDVILTIDTDIQEIAEYCLKDKLKEVGGKSGTVIVLMPRSGEILAMATEPCQNLGMKRGNDPWIWKNRAVQDQFEPGSVFKLVTIAGLLNNDLVKENDIVEDGTGFISIKNLCFEDETEHGPLTFKEAISISSNVAFIKMGKLSGKDNLYETARALGFGSLTGIELPGEAEGYLPLPQTWTDLKAATIAFGQGVSCTALQLTMAYGAIANDGILLKPIIVKEIMENGRSIYQSSKEEVRIVTSEQTAKRTRDLLTTVVEKGTGSLAKLDGIKVAGKTGTAQKWEDGSYSSKYIASFAGFFPVDSPQILITCIIDEPQTVHSAGVVCAPMFKDIAEGILRLKQYRETVATCAL